MDLSSAIVISSESGMISGICFFFQAEDGIRDLTVTGVQTCALPICKRREFRIAQEALVTSATDTSRLAGIRYKGGVSSYLEVLNSEQQLFDSELGLVRSNRDELLAVVRLYRALGGGWQEEREASAGGPLPEERGTR